jgi:4-hydroxy-tetrahydrodipicolinate synthase
VGDHQHGAAVHGLLQSALHRLLRLGIEASRGRVPVVTGVAEYPTRGACRWAAEAERLGADGLMVLPGMVYKAQPHENLHHFRTVAKASRLPIMVYNNPVSYGVDLKPEHVAQLADEPTIVAVKESSDDPRRITDLFNLTGNRFVILGGVDDLALESILLGAVGWVSGLVNAFPEENRLLWDLAMAGRWQEARDIYRWYTPLLHLDTLPTLVQCIKLADAEVGFGSETVRAPRRPLVGAEREEVLRIIRTAIATRPKVPAR